MLPMSPLEQLPDYFTHAVLSGGWLFLGWSLHYLPFWSFGRVLYFHHYMPAELFSCMQTAVVLDCLVRLAQSLLRLPGLKYILYTLVMLGTLASFYLFAGLTYGMDRPLREMKWMQWLPSWEVSA